MWNHRHGRRHGCLLPRLQAKALQGHRAASPACARLPLGSLTTQSAWIVRYRPKVPWSTPTHPCPSLWVAVALTSLPPAMPRRLTTLVACRNSRGMMKVAWTAAWSRGNHAQSTPDVLRHCSGVCVCVCVCVCVGAGVVLAYVRLAVLTRSVCACSRRRSRRRQSFMLPQSPFVSSKRHSSSEHATVRSPLAERSSDTNASAEQQPVKGQRCPGFGEQQQRTQPALRAQTSVLSTLQLVREPSM